MHCCSFRLRVTRNLIMTRLGLWTWLSAFLPIYYGTPTIPDKIFGTKYRIPVILDRKRKVCYPFLQDFWLLLSKLNFLKRDWVPGFVSTQIWDFSNISLFPRILSPKSFANSFGNLYTRFAILDIKFGFTCFIKKYCEAPKYYDQDCLKISFLLSTFPMMIQISGKSAHLVLKS